MDYKEAWYKLKNMYENFLETERHNPDINAGSYRLYQIIRDMEKIEKEINK